MRKRRLKLPFRILINTLLIIALLAATLFGVYKYYIEEDLKDLTKAYEDTIFLEEYSNDINVKNTSYTIAILGLDETLEYSRVDSINLMVVNPVVNEINIYSVPRDSYVQYECIDDLSDKITNSHSLGGLDCTLDALSNVFSIEIDFFIKLDFDGFLTIIDQLGTIETDVPNFYNGQQWCEQTSNRVDQICFNEFGKQRVNSEQALAIARSRQHSSDLDRNVLQSQIIADTIKEVLKLRDLKKLEEITYALDGKVLTNINKKQVVDMTYTMYNFTKEDKTIKSSQLQGEALYMTGSNAGYGSYFVLDVEQLQITREEIAKLINKK